MNSNDRFNRAEISKILKRATELEHDKNISEEDEELTLQELQQVSKEVGIDPKYVQQAIAEIQEREQSFIPNLIGGPFKHHIRRLCRTRVIANGVNGMSEMWQSPLLWGSPRPEKGRGSRMTVQMNSFFERPLGACRT